MTIPPGRHALGKPLQISQRTRGSGKGRTVLDFSQADPFDFVGRSCVEITGRGSLAHVSVIGPGEGLAPVVSVDHGDPGLRLWDVHATGSPYACFRILEGDRVRVRGLTSHDDSDPIGYNYGLVLVRAKRAQVLRSDLHGARHGVAMSAGTEGAVVRSCSLSSNVIAGADFHAGVKGCAYVSCQIRNGITFGGLSNVVRSCSIGPDDHGRSVYLHGLGDMDHTIEGCDLRGTVLWDRGADETPMGGTLTITRNTIRADRAIFLRNRYEQKASVRIHGNTIVGSMASQVSSLGKSTRWEGAEITGNTIFGDLLVGAHAWRVVDEGNARG